MPELTPHRKAQKAAWNRKHRAERRAQGLCAMCGVPVTPPPEPEKRGDGRPRTGYRCDPCLEKMKNPPEPGLTSMERAWQRLMDETPNRQILPKSRSPSPWRFR